MNGKSRLLVKQPHHMEFADKESFRQRIHIQIFLQMTVQVLHPLHNPLIFRCHRIGIEGAFLPLPSTNFHQQTQQNAVAEDLTTIFYAGQFLLQGIRQGKHFLALPFPQTQNMPL